MSESLVAVLIALGAIAALSLYIAHLGKPKK